MGFQFKGLYDSLEARVFRQGGPVTERTKLAQEADKSKENGGKAFVLSLFDYLKRQLRTDLFLLGHQS